MGFRLVSILVTLNDLERPQRNTFRSWCAELRDRQTATSALCCNFLRITDETSVIRRKLTAACRICYILIFTGLTFRSECRLGFAWQFVDVCRTKLLSIWRNTAYHSQTMTVDSVFAQPDVTFFLCNVIVELLAVGPSLLLVRRRGTLYLTIYVLCHVAIVILNVSYNPFCFSSTSAYSALEVFLNIDALYKFTLSIYLAHCS